MLCHCLQPKNSKTLRKAILFSLPLVITKLSKPCVCPKAREPCARQFLDPVFSIDRKTSAGLEPVSRPCGILQPPDILPHSPRELETPASRPHKPGLAMSRLSDQTKCQRWRLSRKVWSRTWLKNKLGITDKWSHKGTHRAHAHKCCDRLHFLHFKEMYGNTD